MTRHQRLSVPGGAFFIAATLAASVLLWSAPDVARAAESNGAEPDLAGAYERLAADDPVAALAAFTEIAAAGGPLSEVAWFEQVRLTAEQDGQSAVNSAREFLDRHPDSVFALAVREALADALLDRGQAAEALRIIDRVLVESPEETPDAWTLRRARALAALGRNDDAAGEAMRVAVECFKSELSQKARELLATLGATGARARAPSADEWTGQFDDYFDKEWFITAGWVADRADRAVPDSATAARLDARSVGCLIYRNRWKSAAAALKRFQAQPTTDKVAQAFALIYDTRVGTLSKADGDARRAALMAAAKMAPGTRAEAEAYWTAGKFELDADRFAKAASDFAHVSRLLSGGWMAREARWNAGFARHLGGEDAKAAVDFQALVEAAPDDEDVDRALYWWGRAAQGAGDAKTAERAYRQVVDRFGRTYYGLAAEVRLETMGYPDHRIQWALEDSFIRRVWASWLGLPILDPSLEQAGGGGEIFDAGARATLEQAAAAGPACARGAFAAIAALVDRGRLDDAKRLADFVRPVAETESGLPYSLSVAYAVAGAQLDSIKMADAAAKQVREGRIVDPHHLVARRQYPLLHWDVIQRNAKDKNLDAFLMLGLVKQESAFQIEAHSWAAAKGLMQVIPATGRYIARRRGIKGAVDLFDIETNVDFGTWYFAQAYHGTGGDVPRTLAGYNAGPGRATRWWGENPGRSYDEVIERIPFNETRDYVKIILRNWEMYQRLYRDRSLPPDRDQVFALLTRTIDKTYAIADD